LEPNGKNGETTLNRGLMFRLLQLSAKGGPVVKTPVHIKDLVPDPKNRRKHTPRNVGMIVDAIQDVGVGRSIVIDEKNEILAGNATVDAAGEAGITKVRVVEANGEEIIAVRRVGLTDEQKRKLAIYDNRTAELAEWDVDQLMEDASNSEDLASFFSEAKLDKMIQDHLGSQENDAGGKAPATGNTPKVDFESQYVVLKFDKDVDALHIMEVLGLKAVAGGSGPTLPDGSQIVDGMEGIEKIKAYFKNRDV
jgi:hypothetical protein